MHIRKILRTVMLLALTFAITHSDTSAMAAGKEKVFAQFEAKIASLETSLEKENDAVKRYDLFLTTYEEIRVLRKKNPRQPEEQELNMSLFMDSLSPLPGKKEFQAKKCDQYKKDIKENTKSFSATAKEPFVEKAVKVVDLICK